MLQVGSVLQKRENVLVIYEKDTNTASKCLFLFSVRWKPSADSPEDVPLLDLQRLCCVGYWMSTFIHITHCMDCKMHLHCWMGSMPFFCMKKRPTASFQFPSAASVCGAPFLFVKIKRCWAVRRGWYEQFLCLHVATMPSSTVFRATLPPEGWHARGGWCPCCGERRHPEVSCMAPMTYRNKTTFPSRLMIFEHVE